MAGFPPGLGLLGYAPQPAFFFFFNIYLSICLAVSGLSCGTRDLC